VRFSTHQLEGCAAEWCDNYYVIYPNIVSITWDQLQGAFCTPHVVVGAIALKRHAIHKLLQGACTMTEYMWRPF
jgi:hypothetical protein